VTTLVIKQASSTKMAQNICMNYLLIFPIPNQHLKILKGPLSLRILDLKHARRVLSVRPNAGTEIHYEN